MVAQGKRFKAIVGLFAVAFLLLGGTVSFAAAEDFYPLDEVRPGMWGVARTVVQGTQIESFSVEILAVLENAGSTGSLIMVKASGDVIERVGGLALGMSGSPVYIDGRLVGAISHIVSGDTTIGMVTPIDDMLALMRLAEGDRVGNEGHVVQSASGMPEAVTPLQTPLLVSGLGERSFARLSDVVRPWSLTPTRTGGTVAPASEGTLEPGSALAVQLMRGDISMVAIGTLTHIEDDLFVGFGHPLEHSGRVDLPVAPAYIHRTIAGFPPYKVGAALETVGRATQDRGAGVAGILGDPSPLTTLTVNVFDRDTNRRSSFTTEIVQHEALLPDLVWTGALEFVDRGIDRIGRGTARVVVQIEGEGLPRRVVRDNLIYSFGDVGATAVDDAMTGIYVLLENEYQEVRLERVQIDLDIEEERWTARIIDVQPERTSVVPGDVLPVTVTLLPYRGTPEEYIVHLPIADEIGEGELYVMVRPGGYGPLEVIDLQTLEWPDWGSDDEGPGYLSGVTGLSDLIDEYVHGEKWYEIVLEYWPDWVEEPAGSDSEAWETGNLWVPVVASTSTRYVVEGYEEFVITVLSDDEAVSVEAEAHPAEEV